MTVEHPDHRRIEPIEPDHGTVGFIAMVVPAPGWRQDEIAWLHQGALALVIVGHIGNKGEIVVAETIPRTDKFAPRRLT